MSLLFEVAATSPAGGRRGRMHLPHGTVETPVFMPVGTAATVKAVPQDTLETLGTDEAVAAGEQPGAGIILGNTYHLYLRPGHEAIQRMGGLHRFMSWDRPLLTDSGGYQVFSLSALRKISEEGVRFSSHLDGSKHMFSPEHSMAVQLALGSDIAMAFDECLEYPADEARARASLELTMRWAARSLAYWEAHKHEAPWWSADASGRRRPGPVVAPEARPSLFGIVQGGMYPSMRREAAERMVAMDFPGYAIGGLAVGEPRERTLEIIAATLPYLPADKPRYVMGVGYPEEIAEYARMGVDMMDCVLPTRAGRHGLLFTSEGRLNIKNRRFAEDQGPADPECGCPVCRRYTRAYLRHLFAAGEPLAATLNSVHNLAFYLETMRCVRAELAASRTHEMERSLSS
ncbi:tRNA guanosine transglycosylase [Acidipila sp. EB88]|uniref:tRNA guanosine(34) transglycosylase Tgt n=1 Tax=Acidipila sp. EB88 TaxID=2305226 RepID=UPI000F5D5092|nr:tRNA guanosine(34) transglycosylase Tgt [Acidipila sp. EB88]RRA48361.1 tRNA guanosine(34) transglycosylase Tgt [Acidipila sp. EB88]